MHYCLHGKAKNKKKFAVALPSAMTIALGKARKIAATISQICRVQWPLHSAKKILKKIKNTLPSALAVALGKEIFLKNKNRLCRVPRRYGTRQRILKKKKILCRVLHSAKKLKKFKTAWAFGQRPSILCRVQAWHSAKPLPSARDLTLGLYREKVRRSLFAECCTRQRICRVHGCLCRVHGALSKACGCCSE